MAQAAEPTLDFNRDIRPLLSDRCFTCHGFDARARKAELRLDTPEGAYAKREHGTTIVPGKPDDSLLWQRITTTDRDDVMPPSDSHLKLSDSEKDLLRRWIVGGAAYQPPWAQQRVVKAEPPSPGPPVDSFVATRLAKEGLGLAPEAPRPTLIRRLSFDLRGIPPSKEEVDAFLADAAPDAYDKLVDRFLADPSYGERMAWPWLDAARYADSNGFQGDADRTMWPWRDWVVSAFNRNLPYDQFTVWQLAGDLMPRATDEQILATGFLRNHPINGEGGSIPEENRVQYAMDMAETTGTVWMGLTMNCCRCHDHKYDPLTQRDYYSLFAFFNQSPVDGSGGDPQTPPVIPVPTEAQRPREHELIAAIESARSKMAARQSAVEVPVKDWEAEQLAKDPWSLVAVGSVTGTEAKVLNDGSVLTYGANPVNATYVVRGPVFPGHLTAVRLDALRDPSMTAGGIARSDSGNFVLTGFEAVLALPDGTRQPLEFGEAKATYEQAGLPVKAALDADPKSGWAVYEGKPVDRDHSAVFHLRAPIDVPAGSLIEFTLRHESRHAHHNLGRFRLMVSGAADPPLPASEAIILTGVLRIPDASRTPEQRQMIMEAARHLDPEWLRLKAEMAKQETELTGLRKSMPKVMVMADRKEYRTSHVLSVGAYDKPLAEVVAATPAMLPALKTAGERANRLDLARWLVSRDHPLTSRVTVNRIWQEFFGLGLVKTPENFGVQSELPVYPELLDWLAADFMDNGWDMKRLVRTIVTSRTYRQDSKISPALLEKDPANRLLARGPRFRLPAWMIRDQALAASGLLVTHLGGAPVKPYQPENLWPEATFGKVKYVRDKGDALYRRSLYTFWRRISAPPMFFDNAKRDVCTVSASRTNTPLHALYTLNDVTFVEAARVLAARAAKDAGTEPAAILPRAFELLLGRPPAAEENAILLESYEHAKASFAADPKAVKDFLENGDSRLATPLPPLDHAALASVCLSLLNLDEAITKE